MGLLLFMVISAVISAVLAKEKRRSVGLAVFVGLILPLVAIIIYALIPTAKKVCPKCGEPNAPTRTFCKECNTPLL